MLHAGFDIICVQGALALKSLFLFVESLGNVLEIIEEKQLLLVDLLENITNLFLNCLHVNFLFFNSNLKLIRANLKHHVCIHDF